MNKKQLAIAEARHARGEQWYDGPALFVPELDGVGLGVGTVEELDALKADEVIPSEATYRPIVPADLA